MSNHIVYCTTCGNAWSDPGVLPVSQGESTCACTCANPENELWVAMSAARFVAADALIIQAEDYARQDADAIHAEAYQDGYENGRADAIGAAGGTLSPAAYEAADVPDLPECGKPVTEKGVAITGAFCKLASGHDGWCIPWPDRRDVLTTLVEANRRSLAEERRICLHCYDEQHDACTGGRLNITGVLEICACPHHRTVPEA